ncbi:hypothetical protein [Escherichia coli]
MMKLALTGPAITLNQRLRTESSWRLAVVRCGWQQTITELGIFGERQ